jgi:hypothetical protein
MSTDPNQQETGNQPEERPEIARTEKHYKVVAGSDLDGMENYPLSEATIIGDLEAYLNRQRKAGWRFVGQIDRWLYDEKRQFLVFEPAKPTGKPT